MEQKEKEKLGIERCYEMIKIKTQNLHSLSNSINLYVAYGCSFIILII